MAKLPDGHVFIYKPNGIKIEIEERELVTCKNCRIGEMETNFYGEPCVVCYNPANGVAHVWHKPDWFCADGKRRDNNA